MNSATVFTGMFLLTTSTNGLVPTTLIGAKSFGRVERHLGHRWRDHDRRLHAPQQRMSVRRGAGDRLAGNRAIGADPVLDDEWLFERIGEVLRRDARHAVGIAACCVRHQDTDRPLRPILGLRARPEGDATTIASNGAINSQVVFRRISFLPCGQLDHARALEAIAGLRRSNVV